MQKDAAGSTSTGGNEHKSVAPRDFEVDLLEEVGREAATRGVRPEAVADAVRESILEVEHNKEEFASEKECRSHLLGLTVWKLFGQWGWLWIPPRTAAGNGVPPGLLAEGYWMWKRARSFAARYRVDSATAAEVLVRAIHETADRLAISNLTARGEEIRLLPNFLFAAFKYKALRVATQQGTDRRYYVEWKGLEDVNDHGAFKRAIENRILCMELLDVMPPMGRSAASSRSILGWDWEEVAEALDTSVNAAQKAQTVGFQKAFQFCTRQIRRIQRSKTKAAIPPPSGGDTPS